MIDPATIRNEPEKIKKSFQNRGYPLDSLNNYLYIDKEWRKKTASLDNLKEKRNKLLPKGKPNLEIRTMLTELAQEIKKEQETVRKLLLSVKEAALLIPNTPLAETPEGHDEASNILLEMIGKKPSFSFSPIAHEIIGSRLGIINTEAGHKIAGSRFSVLSGWGAKLERALAQYMLDTHVAHGYTEISAPLLVNTNSLQGTGQLPKFSHDQYKIDESDLWLSPTAEVQLTNLYSATTFKDSDLPIKLTGHTACFRKEAGSYGKDMKGLIRQHQFYKVELVHIVSEKESEKSFLQLVQQAESILQNLKLPYQKKYLCTGDLGFSAAQTIDLEVWFPSQDKYREISSCSHFLDFQARRAMIKYKGKDQKTRYVHTLNGSGLAIGRTLAAILENYQTDTGAIVVPDVLIPYMGTEIIND